eukprot:CAMPEP_0177216732 /NCGR_PEP_ID=MMETSP0367-20130122/34913_1 /TAXON_ID=447022 ORGANISM="Scrippsiella hangoei-like, Strain SHHI-4" /NCGR_SAMPLE_ID=MMETSP0367 /ASSEMBLY_ACC=CAM_ASM_000362 /LENGTH=50 /DNA_ID=CAMNT_0018666265 /DNA_START=103 /DNA_END=251 /DNA_ORIENTATION=-
MTIGCNVSRSTVALDWQRSRNQTGFNLSTTPSFQLIIKLSGNTWSDVATP